MITGLSDLFWSILVSSTTALILGPVTIWIARRIRLVDRPGSALHKQHRAVTPMAGGMLLVSTLAISMLALPIKLSPDLKAILAGVAVVTVFGLLDDGFNLAPQYKLLGQFLAAACVIYFGIQVHISQVAWIDLGLTLLWIIGITNAFNFVDSMDGLAIGLAGITAAFFMLVAVDSFQPDLAKIAAVLLGTMIGSFIYSSPPARMFLGDSGSQALGIALASIGIAYTPGQAGLPQGSTWFVPILALGIPIFDMVLVIVSRIRRRQPIYRANRDHFYHRLTLLGLHPNHSVSLMQIIAILLSLVAFITLGSSVLLANVIFGSIALCGVLVMIYLEMKLLPQRGDNA